MALIICPECKKEYSDRAAACPNCGCPTNTSASPAGNNSHTFISEPPKQQKSLKGIIILALSLILCGTLGYYLYKSLSYSSGESALYSGDYAAARGYLQGLNFQSSEKMLVDCSFLEELEKSVERDIELLEDDSDEILSLEKIEDDIETFKAYKKADFYTEKLYSLYDRYLTALKRQRDAFDEVFSNPLTFEYEILAGTAQCHEVLITLNNGIGFMNSNPDFKTYIADRIEKKYDFLARINELQQSGHIDTKETTCNFVSVTRYLRNDTNYISDQIFYFDFYNYAGDTFLERVEVEVKDVPANAEYTVKCDIPRSAKNGYTVQYNQYYTDIRLSVPGEKTALHN